MKRYLLVLCLTVVGFSGSAFAVPFNSNLLLDPGFEAPTLTGWVPEGTSTLTLTSDSHVGSQAVRVDYLANFHGIKQDIAISPGDRLQDYRLTFVFKNPVGISAIQGIRPVVGEFGPSGFDFHASNFGWSTTNWQQWIYDFTLVRSDTAALSVILQGHTTLPGSFIIDAASLTKVPEPTTIALLSMGALGFLRKRALCHKGASVKS